MKLARIRQYPSPETLKTLEDAQGLIGKILAALQQEGVVRIQDFKDLKEIYVQDTMPTKVEAGTVWVDTS